MNLQDVEPLTPCARGTTTIFKTGQWSQKKPFYMEKVSPCREACPAGSDIPSFLSFAAEGDFDYALELLLQENPLPCVCGRVCYHPCQTECNRGQFDQEVEIRSLERAIAEFGSAVPKTMSAPGHSPQSIAIIGSGPAGLSCAYFLARFGHKVKIFEKNKEPGGVLRYGIPDYRLPKGVLRKEINRILSLGIDLESGINVDRKMLDNIRSRHDTLFLSIGTWIPRRVGAQNENSKDVLHGLDFLADRNSRGAHRDKKRVVVIGGGDVAVDVARTALRVCARDVKVTMVAPEALDEFPAIPESIKEALEEGIEIIGGYRPSEFKGTESLEYVRLAPAKVDKDPRTGMYRMLPAKGKDLVLDADFAIVAIGQIPDSELFRDGLLDEESHKVYVNEFGMTTAERVYAGGDLIRQRPAVVDAIASGKRAALAIHLGAQACDTEEIIPPLRLGAGSSLSMQSYIEEAHMDLKRVVQFSELNTLLFRRTPPYIEKTVSPGARVQGFREVRKGLERVNAVEEAKRCFNCGRCIQCDLCFLLCPDISIIKTGTSRYEVDADYCKGCSICATTCPRHVIEMGDGR